MYAEANPMIFQTKDELSAWFTDLAYGSIFGKYTDPIFDYIVKVYSPNLQEFEKKVLIFRQDFVNLKLTTSDKDIRKKAQEGIDLIDDAIRSIRLCGDYKIEVSNV